MAIVTLNNLLEKSKEWEENLKKEITITVERLEGDIKLRKLSTMEYLDIIQSNSKDKDAEALYNCCVEPNLSSDEVLTAFGCKDNPEGVVDKIFTRAEKMELSKIILAESGISGENVITKAKDDIKN